MAKPLDAVIADLTHETAGWSSLDARISLRQTLLATVDAAPAGTLTAGREQYTATSLGQKRYAQYSEVAGREVCVLLGATDGIRFASVRFQPPPREARQRSITITKTFLDEAETGFAAIPTAFPFYVGLVPIREALTRAVPVGPSQVAGRDCTRFLFPAVPDQGATRDLVYHLDAATSVPLKVESFANRAQAAAGAPFSVWEADHLDEVQGFHVATDSRYTTFARSSQGQPVPELVNQYHVDSIRFNDPTSAATFWPTYDPGVFINDAITDRSFFNTPDGKSPTRAATAAGSPTTTSWVTGGAITLGLVLLVVGLARRFRGG